jgi:hypothetical protein
MNKDTFFHVDPLKCYKINMKIKLLNFLNIFLATDYVQLLASKASPSKYLGGDIMYITDLKILIINIEVPIALKTNMSQK